MKWKMVAERFEVVVINVVVGFVMSIWGSENVGDVCHGSHSCWWKFGTYSQLLLTQLFSVVVVWTGLWNLDDHSSATHA